MIEADGADQNSVDGYRYLQADVFATKGKLGVGAPGCQSGSGAETQRGDGQRTATKPDKTAQTATIAVARYDFIRREPNDSARSK